MYVKGSIASGSVLDEYTITTIKKLESVTACACLHSLSLSLSAAYFIMPLLLGIFLDATEGKNLLPKTESLIMKKLIVIGS